MLQGAFSEQITSDSLTGEDRPRENLDKEGSTWSVSIEPLYRAPSKDKLCFEKLGFAKIKVLKIRAEFGAV